MCCYMYLSFPFFMYYLRIWYSIRWKICFVDIFVICFSKLYKFLEGRKNVKSIQDFLQDYIFLMID